MFNNYNAENFDPNAGFDVPPPGKYRVRIEGAEETTSKAGAKMIKLMLTVSGHSGILFHYIVDNEYAQRNLDTLFDSFGMQPGDFNYLNWRGKVGAAQLKTEQYNGADQARVSYFILRSKQKDLPAWVEGGSSDYGRTFDGPMSLRDDPDFLTAAAGSDVVNVPF
jgi:hypothetical protein